MTDFVDVSQSIIEVLSLEDDGSDFVNVSQFVVEVLSFAPCKPIHINVPSLSDNIHVNVPEGTVTIHMQTRL